MFSRVAIWMNVPVLVGGLTYAFWTSSSSDDPALSDDVNLGSVPSFEHIEDESQDVAADNLPIFNVNIVPANE